MYNVLNGFCNINKYGANNFFGGVNIMMIGFVILTIIFVYYLFKDKNINVNSKEQSSMEILEKEFAKGNISKEEFIERKELLNK